MKHLDCQFLYASNVQVTSTVGNNDKFTEGSIKAPNSLKDISVRRYRHLLVKIRKKSSIINNKPKLIDLKALIDRNYDFLG